MNITVNKKEYEIVCVSAHEQDSKVPRIIVFLQITDKTQSKLVNSKDFFNTYLSEKICELITELINKKDS